MSERLLVTNDCVRSGRKEEDIGTELSCFKEEKRKIESKLAEI